MNIPYPGELAALLTALLWSFTSIFFAEAGNRIGSVQLNMNRLIIAAVFILLTIIIGQLDYSFTKMQLILLVISGFIGFVFGDSFLFKSYQYVGPRIGMLIMALSPGMTSVLGYFFLQEYLSLWSVIGITITIAGVAMVVLEKKEKPNKSYKIEKIGLLYAFLGALGQSVGLVFAKAAFVEGPINPFVVTFIRLVSAIVFFMPLLLVIKRYKNPIKLYKKDLKALWFTCAGSFVGPYLGVTFSFIAISLTKIGIAATLMSTMPIIMLPMVYFYYKEKISWASIIGACVAVGGVAILFIT